MSAYVFGISLTPSHDLSLVHDVTDVAERGGLDLVGVQDHPYVADFLDAPALIGHLLTRTTRLRFFPDVANLPLRPPALLARTAATLNVLSGGRFELGIGAGGYWDAITAMGVPRRSSAEALAALEEAITIMRELWSPGRSVRFHGDHYRVDGVHGAEAGTPPINVWIGAQGPRSLALTGRVADGWAAPIPSYLPYERWAESHHIIDRAAEDAGRDPGSVVRLAQVVGTIEANGSGARLTTGADPLRAGANGWAAELTRIAAEQPFTGFVFWPERQSVDQVRRFAEEVVPAVKANLA
ncbi:LLM class flavin-dependent oxidoreductase [Nonomuraea jiangxiensis]|uniref:Flavin-dependent oxidoreductase, luciferase family (Includes alkanesulfonate monooxygenase SsuD and methylene tetrahydromethanopterin reductase) n=1 Tax=Nonomuraea jiangxiensis TaxID=633440 RepID=A0A1G9IWV2_9ACTN|nr:LLM class flavin-dependent oxidoreductase [Nonomuraea jiangxiensis]SDL29433.1 Flavin-dependent oxidoreductase, luciferase family (includes alkanesulfonate monooxygenase SsuD and methylene tetrahydromethanopterin reductase) [Nonomuraea jiangxiensis]